MYVWMVRLYGAYIYIIEKLTLSVADEYNANFNNNESSATHHQVLCDKTDNNLHQQPVIRQ